MVVLTLEEANACLDRFQRDWPHLVRLRIAEVTIARAAQLAWQHRLRGYDAVHLAAAILWQEALGELVTMATFDLTLWQAVIQVGMQAFPADLPALLEPLKIQDMNKSI